MFLLLQLLLFLELTVQISAVTYNEKVEINQK